MAIAGLRRLVMCTAGTLGGTPGALIAMGLRGAAGLQITEFKQVEDYRKRKLRNMLNIKVEAESLQPNLRMLNSLISFLNFNCDAEVTTQKQSSSTYDCFQFTGNYLMGLGFEYGITGDKRYCKTALERAFEHSIGKTFIDTADATTMTSLSGITTPEGEDFSSYRPPNLTHFQSPSGTTIMSTPISLVERSLTIKTEAQKNYYNGDIVNFLNVELSLTSREASIAQIITLLSKGLADTIEWKEANGTSTFDKYVINANTLTLTNEVKMDDENRTIKATFSGNVPLYDVSFTFATTASGDVLSGTGIAGGTMTIGA